MTKMNSLRFNIGDKIVHNQHGVGEVMDILKRGFEGHQETYFRVTTTEIEYWLPVNRANADHITPVRSVEDFEEALEIINEPPSSISEPPNQYKRLIHQRWMDGGLLSRAALIRDLNGRNSIKELSYDEKGLFEKIKRFFIDEWTIANPSLTKPEAIHRLGNALEKSIKHK